MSNIVHDTEWGTIYFNTQTGSVFIQQKWFYKWKVWVDPQNKIPTPRPWTLLEKQRFHAIVDSQIWGTWSGKIKFSLTGSSDIVKKLRGTTAVLNFDVKWVLTPPYHWTVEAWKLPRNSSPTDLIWSEVNPYTKTIKLNTSDLTPRTAFNDVDASAPGFKAAPHEFGHTILRPNVGVCRSEGDIANTDEYFSDSWYIGDTASLMNIGRKVRQRHLTEVVVELNKLVPGVIFNVRSPSL